MWVRIKARAPGDVTVPLDVNLPSAYGSWYDPISVTAVCEIPDEDAPPLWDAQFRMVDSSILQAPVMVELSDAAHEAWYAKLDERYREHAGKFRPRIA